jgi:hypothetical protein
VSTEQLENLEAVLRQSAFPIGVRGGAYAMGDRLSRISERSSYSRLRSQMSAAAD